MNQDKFSETLNISIQYLSEVERGAAGITVPFLKAFCEKYCVSADYILFGKREENEISPIVQKLKFFSPKNLEIVEQVIANFILAVIHAKKEKGQ